MMHSADEPNIIISLVERNLKLHFKSFILLLPFPELAPIQMHIFEWIVAIHKYVYFF